jgi:fibronectin type 3 domain-containing protein
VARLAQTDSSFSDSKVEKGRKYEYAITALDKAGNESRKSEPVPGVARDDTP